jgi:hypothetical protein
LEEAALEEEVHAGAEATRPSWLRRRPRRGSGSEGDLPKTKEVGWVREVGFGCPSKIGCLSGALLLY